MLISSGLRSILALLCVLTTVQVGMADDTPLKSLQGKWQVKRVTMNGKPIEDRQASNSQLTFSDDELRWKSDDGSDLERFKLKPEADARPPAIHLSRVEPANRPQTGWMIYEFTEGHLRLCYFDALQGRPTSFEPQEKLTVLELEKAP